MKAKTWQDTVMTRLWEGEGKEIRTRTTELLHQQAEKSFKVGLDEGIRLTTDATDSTFGAKLKEERKAGMKYVLSRAVGEGCISTVNGKHGVHIPDELYEDIKRAWKDSKPS